MSAAPDYQNYTLEELQDALWSIDRTKFPDRYELLKSEIERKDSRRDETVVLHRKNQRRLRAIRTLKIFNCLQYGALFCVGVIYPIWTEITVRPDTDMRFYLLLVPFTLLVLAAGGIGVWQMRRALKNVVSDDEAQYWSLYALALAPYSCFFVTLVGAFLSFGIAPLLFVPIGYALPFLLFSNTAKHNKT